jgi:hypothetical protein
MSLTIILAGLATATAPVEDHPERESAASAAVHPTTLLSGPDPVYPADFYAPFQPQTALDMLERTPGFLLSEGSSVRGFGGAAGNVLIDGQRPTVKAGGVTEVLRRISASQVERIQLMRGADAAEAQGQTLVANVILRADAAGSGNASLTLSHTMDGRISPSGRISHARHVAGWQTNIELFGEMARHPGEAVHWDRDATGALVRTRVEHTPARAPEYGMALSTSGRVAGGVLTVNLRLNGDGYVSDSRIDILNGPAEALPNAVPDAVRTIAYEEEGQSGELGIDWTRSLGSDWTAKLVGLGRIERWTSDEDYAEPGYRGVSALRQKPMELVGRTTLTREGHHAIRPEIGMEVAWNRLSSHLDYAEDMGGGLTPVALSNADTRVTELRGEAFANVTVKLASRLDLETGVAFELSRIRVIGALENEQSLSYLKPSAALVWSVTPRTQVRLGARRTVDQLDFGDFAASVDQADGRPLGGNAALRPARVTRALARLDHRWGKGGALAIEASHQWHTDLLGYLLLPSGDEALGTIGDAREWIIEGQFTLPLDAALPGARLTTDGKLRGSRLRDPLTGQMRELDDRTSTYLSAEFRHDLPKLKSSWGISYTSPYTKTIFYNREILTARTGPQWGAFIETTALRGFKTTLEASAIGGADSQRARRFYSPSRAGTFSGSEDRDLHSGAVISLTLARAL